MLDGHVKLLRGVEGLQEAEEPEIPPRDVEIGAEAQQDGVRCCGVGGFSARAVGGETG